MQKQLFFFSAVWLPVRHFAQGPLGTFFGYTCPTSLTPQKTPLHLSNNPDPPIPAFLAKKGGCPEKSEDFPPCRTLEILGKESKNAQKSKENRQKRTKKRGKRKKARIGGSGKPHATKWWLERNATTMMKPMSDTKDFIRDEHLQGPQSNCCIQGPAFGASVAGRADQGLYCQGPKKATQTFFVQSFSTTPRVGHGRPRRKSWTSAPKNAPFPAASVVGRNFLTPGHPGVRVRNVRRKSGPNSLCLCCFSSLNYGLASGTLLLQSKPCLGVKGGCVSVDTVWSTAPLRQSRGTAQHGATHLGQTNIGRREIFKRPPPPRQDSAFLDFTKDPRPLYYKTPPCVFYHKNVCSKAVFGPQ